MKNTIHLIASSLLASASFAMAAPGKPAANDIDGDCVLNRVDKDLDNDGKANSQDRNIDGGIAMKGPARGKWVGDRLVNAADKDMDADALVNIIDPDIDGDGVKNERDRDANSDGTPDLIDFTDDGGGGYYLPDNADVLAVRAVVSAGLIKQLKLDSSGYLKVAVVSTSEPIGTWRYLTPDGKLSLNGTWRYTRGDPDSVSLIKYEDETQRRIYAQFVNGPLTLYSWTPDEPVTFSFNAPSSGNSLDDYFSSIEDLVRTDQDTTINYSGSIGAFSGVAKIITQQRDILTILTTAD